MKKHVSILILIEFLSFGASYAQEFDIQSFSPVNPMPQEYNVEHFRLYGDVKTMTNGADIYTFTEDGRLLSIKTPTISQTFEYDTKNHLKTIVTLKRNGITKETFKTDNLGRIVKHKWHSGRTYEFTYNDLGQVTEVVDEGVPGVNSFDDKGRIVRIEYPTLTVDYEYLLKDDLLFVNQFNTTNGKRKFHVSNAYNLLGTRYKNETVVSRYDGYGNLLRGYNNLGAWTIFSYTYHNPKPLASKSFTMPKSECTSGNCEDGWGILTFGAFAYTGFFEHGLRNGYGSLKAETYEYKGQWKNDIDKGFMILVSKNYKTFGEYELGQKNGDVVATEGDNIKAGYYSLDNRIKDYMLYSRNNHKDCEFGNCEDDFGKLTYENGDVFMGMFVGKIPKMGVYTYENGDVYEGYFSLKRNEENNSIMVVPNKFGILNKADGSFYGGEFFRGEYNGKGHQKLATGEERTGQWKRNELEIKF